MKKIYLLLSFLIFSLISFGATHFQEGFSTTSVPSGWTQNSVYFNSTANHGTFTGNNGAGFNATNDWLQTPAENTAGTLSFWIRGSSSPSNIEIKVQKSNDGSTWTDLVTYPKNTFSSTWEQKTIDVNDASTTVYIRFYISSRSGNSIYLDDIQLDDYSPSAPSITLSPSSLSGFSYVTGSGPSSEQSFTVEGSNLTDNITLTPSTNYEISTGSGDSFVATNPITLTQSGGTVTSTTIYVRLKAGLTNGDYNNENIAATSNGATEQDVTCSGTVYKTEPTNHVTGFSAAANGSSTIDLRWTENDGTVVPDGYLIVASTGTPSDPSDGTDPADDTDLTDGSGNVKVAHGTTSYSFTNCSASTTYNFKIYPYTNSGSAIDYKTDGMVPTANATTEAAAAEPGTGDLEITEVNSTQTAYASYAEIYNTTGNELSLDKVDLDFYSNGAASASSTLHLTGSIAAHSYIVIARKQADFNTAYGSDPDFVFSGMYINGGADGLILKQDNNGTLDQFNVAPNGTVSMTDNHLYYRFNYPNDGTDLTADWDDSGRNKNGTPGAANQLTWLTTAGTTDWGTGSNWSNGDVPSKGVDVTIISGNNQPIVDESSSTPGQCMNMTINSGASVTVMVGGYLTVNGTLTNNNGTAAGLIVQSDANGNGSLIVDGTVRGDATVERYIAGYTTAGTGNGWHLLGSPVNNMTISTSNFAPGGNDDLYAWDESTYTWLNYKDGNNGISNFTNGKGYLVAYETEATKSFIGTPNNSDITFNNLSHTSGQGNGWHLLGNPYPSALTWGDDNWALSGVGGVAQVWNESAGNYTNVSQGGVIPSTNGFFVQVSSGTNSLTIPKDDRVHDATNNFKTSTVQHETLRFKVTNDANSYYDVSTLGFKPEATADYDLAFDSHKLFSFVKTAPSLYTVSKDQKFSTNYLPETGSVNTVPVDFIPGVSTVYHLQIDGIKSFNQPNFILEDTQAGIMIDLSQQTEYDFTAQKGDDPNRFVLHINGVTAVPNVNQTDGIQVFAFGKTVYLHGQQSLNGNVSIFNTLGQQVYTGVLNGAAKQQIRLNQQHGVYFVRLKENNRVITKKIFIQ